MKRALIVTMLLGVIATPAAAQGKKDERGFVWDDRPTFVFGEDVNVEIRGRTLLEWRNRYLGERVAFLERQAPPQMLAEPAPNPIDTAAAQERANGHKVAADYTGLADQSVAVVVYADQAQTDEFPDARTEISNFLAAAFRTKIPSVRLLDFRHQHGDERSGRGSLSRRSRRAEDWRSQRADSADRTCAPG